jgi:hypothetical protein
VQAKDLVWLHSIGAKQTKDGPFRFIHSGSLEIAGRRHLARMSDQRANKLHRWLIVIVAADIDQRGGILRRRWSRTRQLDPDVAHSQLGDLAGPQTTAAGEAEQREIQPRVSPVADLDRAVEGHS